MKTPPDIDVTNLVIIQNIVQNHQDKHRAKDNDTEHLSQAQQDLNKLIEFYDE
jgi:hypothetical protein